MLIILTCRAHYIVHQVPVRISKPMEALASITIQRHDIEQGDFGAMFAPRRILQCYRVLGGNPAQAGRVCRARLGSCVFPPIVVLTLEHLVVIGPAHAAICEEVNRVCCTISRELYVCGVSVADRERLAAEGALGKLDRRNFFPTLQVLVASFAGGARHPQSAGASRARAESTATGAALPGWLQGRELH